MQYELEHPAQYQGEYMIRAIVFDLDDTLYDCLHENDKAVDDTVRYVANELLHIDEVTVM